MINEIPNYKIENGILKGEVMQYLLFILELFLFGCSILIFIHLCL